MNQCMNVLTAKTPRRKGTHRYYLKLLSASLRLSVSAVKSSSFFILHKSYVLNTKLSAKLLMSLFLFSLSSFTYAQEIDLLLKNGHVVDPANNINARLDVAIAGGKIIKVAPNIATDQAKKIVDVTGLYVCPGLIDIHTHVFVGSKADTFADGILSLSPDDFTFRAGVTTVVDAGTSGWRNFPLFKDQVIDRSKTRVLAFLNIAGSGMSGKQTQEDINDMDAAKASEAIQKYPDVIVGVKIGHYEESLWTPFDNAIAAAETSNVPLFVECHLPQYSLKDQLNRMRPGDIITHSFEKVSERMSVIDEQRNVRSFRKDGTKKRNTVRCWTWRRGLLV